MMLENEAYEPKGIRDANGKGIYIIHQELNMIPDLTVTENLLLSKVFPKKKRRRRKTDAKRSLRK